MRKPKVAKTQDNNTAMYRVTKPGFRVMKVRVEFTETSAVQPKTFIRQKNDLWLVHYTPGEASQLPITLIITDNVREHPFSDVPI